MKIHSVEAIAIDIPLTKNFGGSTYSVLKRSTVITRLRTKDGLASEVFNGDNREHGAEIVRIIREELFPLAKGTSIFEHERIWEKMFALSIANRDGARPVERGTACGVVSPPARTRSKLRRAASTAAPAHRTAETASMPTIAGLPLTRPPRRSQLRTTVRPARRDP